ncbi:hypothetical protein ART_4338 [Arthrobacter sp. PAMC 25486]|uniref:hypothetical protein n=1 Tax=Arthrobacter sp. PAMC 25486 TaxID=1494608 RepID=UPI00053643A6|nr:hypothetical protein [Arthrobacter sp. PAMC 25486]AIY03937.1 hypothetical protein ART_4338 [Arthrobacter sp. PAMC 25486]
MEPASPIARRGHDEIQRQLTALYGEPARPWDDEDIPPSSWKANGRDLMMHFSTCGTAASCSASTTRNWQPPPKGEAAAREDKKS